ncbi:MAG TPA: cytochrome P450 [Pyrinomonadaceae bacterium]|nr:cytochrome P450 [Pyrinomonadaceae bacterium]
MSSEAPDALAGVLTRAPAVPPGPRGNRFFGPLVRESRRDPLGFTTRVARTYGDVCAFRVGLERVYLVSHPDYVREVFANHYGNFLKGGGRARRFLGEGLLLSEGETHRQRRRLDQPAFHRQRLASYAAEMVAYGEHTSARWRDGQVLDLWPEMLRLTLGVVGKTLFGADVDSEADEVGRAMRAAVSRYRAFRLPLARLLESLPLARMMQYRRGKERLRRVVFKLIEERRREGRDHGDLLSMLLLAEDAEEGGRRLTPEQVWDEAVTLFIAGYDTMATALMWTFYLLSEHPEVEARLHEEIETVLGGGRPATFEDFKRLTYTEQVLAEAMRIYPPVWRLVRRAVADFPLGEYVVPRGSLVIMSQYVMHRDPRFYPEPLRFDPERFAPEARAARPPYSYFPFGGGPRRCLGEGFALTEGVMLLATLARRWRLRLVPGHPVEPFPEHLLRAKHGMLMRLEARGRN